MIQYTRQQETGSDKRWQDRKSCDIDKSISLSSRMHTATGCTWCETRLGWSARGKQSTWIILLLCASVFCYVGNGEEEAEESTLTTAYRSAAVVRQLTGQQCKVAGTARCDNVVQSSTGTQAVMRAGQTRILEQGFSGDFLRFCRCIRRKNLMCNFYSRVKSWPVFWSHSLLTRAWFVLIFVQIGHVMHFSCYYTSFWGGFMQKSSQLDGVKTWTVFWSIFLIESTRQEKISEGQYKTQAKEQGKHWQHNPRPDAYGDGMYMMRNKTRLISRREAKHVEHPVASCIRFLLCRDGNEAHKKAHEEFVKNNLQNYFFKRG